MYIRCENKFINFNMDNDGLEYTVDVWECDELHVSLKIFIIRQNQKVETLYGLTIDTEKNKEEVTKNKITLENKCETIIQKIIDKWKEDKYQTVSIKEIVE